MLMIMMIKKKKKEKSCHCSSILAICPSPRPPEEGLLNCHRQTDGHGDSMIESAQGSQFRENILSILGLHLGYTQISPSGGALQSDEGLY